MYELWESTLYIQLICFLQTCYYLKKVLMKFAAVLYSLLKLEAKYTLLSTVFQNIIASKFKKSQTVVNLNNKVH